MEMWKWILIWTVVVFDVALDMGLGYNLWMAAIGTIVMYVVFLAAAVIGALSSVPSSTLRDFLLSKPRSSSW